MSISPKQLLNYAKEVDLLYYGAHLGYHFCTPIVGMLRSAAACHFLYRHYFNEVVYPRAENEANRLSSRSSALKERAEMMKNTFQFRSAEEMKQYWILQLVRGISEFFLSSIAAFFWVLKDSKYELLQFRQVGNAVASNPFYNNGSITFYNLCGIDELSKSISWEQSVSNWDSEITKKGFVRT